jgi:3-phenylpropionate/trans-cinnamate dioxygenase ferredoxin subunit
VSAGDFEIVAPLEDFQECVPMSLQLSTGELLCLVRVNGEVFGFAEECPHGLFPMSDGAIVEDYIIECSMHGTQFDVRDGSVVEEPGDVPLQTYQVKVLDDHVWVRAQE